jgi:AAA family ATP:ADP antiporter
MATTSPLRQIMDIRRHEAPQAFLMSAYFFLVIATFWILRPLKNSGFLEYYDQTAFRLFAWEFNAAQSASIARLGNMVIAFFAAAVFILLARSLRRQQLTYVFSVFSIACFVVLSYLVAQPTALTIWIFYWFGDLYNTLMVATFFAFLNDSLAPDVAKRLYGVIVLGGVVGGAFGSTVLAVWLDALSVAGWLWVSAGITLVVMLVAGLAGRQFVGHQGGEEKTEGETPSLAASVRLVARSKYLLAIVAVVGLYEMVSTIMNFQYDSAVEFYLDGDAIGSWYAGVSAITNWVALLSQLFLTSFVMTRLGVGTALLFLPVAALAGSLGFLFAPILLIGSFLNVSDNGLNYSINQSGKEVLYTPTTRAEKYQAKAVIDMFVMRFAKAVAVGLSLVITTTFVGFTSVRWLSLATILVLVAWIAIVRYAGREFRTRSSAPGDASERPESGAERAAEAGLA